MDGAGDEIIFYLFIFYYGIKTTLIIINNIVVVINNIVVVGSSKYIINSEIIKQIQTINLVVRGNGESVNLLRIKHSPTRLLLIFRRGTLFAGLQCPPKG